MIARIQPILGDFEDMCIKSSNNDFGNNVSVAFDVSHFIPDPADKSVPEIEFDNQMLFELIRRSQRRGNLLH